MLVHAYNSTRLVITGYSLHYFLYGCQPCLLIDFYFPMIMGMRKHLLVDNYITELHEQLWEAIKEAQVQSTSEVERQKWYYIIKANVVSLEPGDLVLAKAEAYRGRRKVKEQWEEELYKVNARLWKVCNPTSWKNSKRMLISSPLKLTFPHCSYRGGSYLYGCAG